MNRVEGRKTTQKMEIIQNDDQSTHITESTVHTDSTDSTEIAVNNDGIQITNTNDESNDAFDMTSINPHERCQAINKTTQLQCSFFQKHPGKLCGIHHRCRQRRCNGGVGSDSDIGSVNTDVNGNRSSSGIVSKTKRSAPKPLTIEEIKTHKGSDNRRLTRPMLQCTLAAFGIHRKLSGKKKDLLSRFERLQYIISNEQYVLQIQRWWKTKNEELLDYYHGSAWKDRGKCTNNTEFITFDDLDEIPSKNFISYIENDHVYGFTVDSILTLFTNQLRINRSSLPRNPYTRQKLADSLLERAFALREYAYPTPHHTFYKNSGVSKFQLRHVKFIIKRWCDAVEESTGFIIKPAWLLRLSVRKIELAFNTFQRIWTSLPQSVQEDLFTGKKLFSRQRRARYYHSPTKKHLLMSVFELCILFSGYGGPSKYRKSESQSESKTKEKAKSLNERGIIIISAVLWTVCRAARTHLSWAADINFEEWHRPVLETENTSVHSGDNVNTDGDNTLILENNPAAVSI